MNHVEDSQCFSTIGFIKQALNDLLTHYPFEKITVQLIVKKAGISRSTFYLHFQDKFDLLSQLTDDIMEEFLQYYRNPLFLEGNSQNSSKELILPVTMNLCEQVQSYKSFYIDRFKDPEFIALFTKRIHTELHHNFQNETLASFAAYGTVGYIGKWLEEDLERSVHEVALELNNIGVSIVKSTNES